MCFFPFCLKEVWFEVYFCSSFLVSKAGFSLFFFFFVSKRRGYILVLLFLFNELADFAEGAKGKEQVSSHKRLIVKKFNFITIYYNKPQVK